MSAHIPVRYDRRKLFAVGASAGAAALVLPERAKALLESSAASPSNRSTQWLIATLVDSPKKNAVEVIPFHTAAIRRIAVPQGAKVAAPDGSHRLQAFGRGDQILIELAAPSSRDASTGQLNLAHSPAARTITALTFGKASDFHR
jgi:hypothetical protein